MAEPPRGSAEPDRGEGRVAVIVPVCNEEQALPGVLEGLCAVARAEGWLIAVGINGSTDRSETLARDAGVVVGVTRARGYGHGCLAGIDAALRADPSVAVYAFAAGDGATDPADLRRVVARLREGFDLVLGERVSLPENRGPIGAARTAGNRWLARWAGWLGGRAFLDLGPVRAIRRQWLERIGPREMHLGWTIEMQVRAARLGARIDESPVRELPRSAGVQKVSTGSVWRRGAVGLAIARAGWAAARSGPCSEASSRALRS